MRKKKEYMANRDSKTINKKEERAKPRTAMDGDLEI
jgi:hypothetical protein